MTRRSNKIEGHTLSSPVDVCQEFSQMNSGMLSEIEEARQVLGWVRGLRNREY